MNCDEIAALMNQAAGQAWGTEEHFQRFAALVAAAEREACLNCYSPDDTATDWADKIRARGETK